VGSESGLCRTCHSLNYQEQFVDITREPAAANPDVAALASRYLWRKAANREVTVYQGLGNSGTVLVVARHITNGRLFVVTRRLSGQELLRGEAAQ
jgi:hypothetical protein